MRTPHTHYRRGKHVFVILRNGNTFEDIFYDHKSGAVILEQTGRVLLKDVKAMSFRKLREGKRK